MTPAKLGEKKNHVWRIRTFMAGIPVGQVTPGPIVITAAFVRY